MTFGWEGFSLDHPDDWSPAVLTGNRRQGYVRIASPGRRMLQVRWQATRGAVDLHGFLDQYLSRLGVDAKRAGTPFSSSREASDRQIEYRYAGAAHGRGIVRPAPDGRTFALEAVSTKADSTLAVLRAVERSFCADGRAERWSAFGLDLTLPSTLTLERRDFLAGKTSMEWRGKGVRIAAERWGLADQLLARHDLAEWTRALLGVRVVISETDERGLRLSVPGRAFVPPTEALVCRQPERNQIVVVRSHSREPRWRPDWGWLN